MKPVEAEKTENHFYVSIDIVLTFIYFLCERLLTFFRVEGDLIRFRRTHLIQKLAVDFPWRKLTRLKKFARCLVQKGFGTKSISVLKMLSVKK